MLLIILEYAILAATFTLAKKALSFSPPFFLIMTRLLIAGFFLVMYALLRKGINWKKALGDKWLFASVGLFHAYLAFVPEFWALQFVTSAKTSIIYAATPFVAALLSYVLHREKLSSRQWLGMLVGTLGLIPLMVWKVEPGEWGGFFSLSLPELVLIGAMSSACYAWFVIKKLMDRGHSVPLINGVAMGLGGLLCIPTVLLAEPNAINLVTSWSSFAGWLSALIVLSHFASYNLYSWLLKRHSITFMTFCGFMCPLFTTLFGAVFLGEVITWHYFASIAGITSGLALFVYNSRQTPSPEKA
jgi:drug/metabolite transporter (DMT)-like permease